MLSSDEDDYQFRMTNQSDEDIFNQKEVNNEMY